MIRFEHVSCGYEKGKNVLEDITFEIEEGASVGVIGANGAGKSTLMKAMLGLLPHQGLITVDGMEVNDKNIKQIRKKLGFVLQNSDNQMFMPTVYEDVMFAPLNYGVSRQEAEKKTDEVLEKLGLTELKYRHNHRISGGEKKMAAIATVLAMEPEVMLMDEPTSTLDPYNRRIIINTIKALPNTKLISAHDLDMILETCREVILLSKGRMAAKGKVTEILKDRALLEANRMELPMCVAARL